MMTGITEAANKINEFLKSKHASVSLSFREGYYITLKKHIKDDKPYLEIHTSGYDDTLPIDEAIDWLKWELLDRKANGILEA